MIDSILRSMVTCEVELDIQLLDRLYCGPTDKTLTNNRSKWLFCVKLSDKHMLLIPTDPLLAFNPPPPTNLE